MNFTITKEQMLIGLQSVQNVVSMRTTLPILSNVLMRVEGERLEFTATDLDVTVACEVEAKIKEGGAATVPVKKLYGIARELGGSEIEIGRRMDRCSAAERRIYMRSSGITSISLIRIEIIIEGVSVCRQSIIWVP